MFLLCVDIKERLCSGVCQLKAGPDVKSYSISILKM